jgi:putative ABC transport system ATP-binding protein
VGERPSTASEADATGRVRIDGPAGQEVRAGNGHLARRVTQWRASAVGFVFQSFNLIPVLTAAENVELPLLLSRLPRAERTKRAETALRVVGVTERAKHYPRQLSGGQEQRVATARAIVNDPQLIVADEPTSDLDRKAAAEILDLLGRLNRELEKTIVMVTHDSAAAGRSPRSAMAVSSPRRGPSRSNSRDGSTPMSTML